MVNLYLFKLEILAKNLMIIDYVDNQKYSYQITFDT